MGDAQLGELGQSVIAHQVLGPPDDPWLEVHEGRLNADEAARQLRGVEPDEVIEQSKAIFELGFTEIDRRRFDEVLARYRENAPVTKGASLLLPWGALALAAAVLIWLLLPARSLGTYYELELRQGAAEMHGPNDREEIRTYWANRSLEAWLRPAEALDGPMELAVYARRDSEVRRLTVEPTFEDNGAVHILAKIESLGLTVGEWELLFVVGREGTVPGSIEDLPAPEADDTRLPYTVLSVWVRIIPPR